MSNSALEKRIHESTGPLDNRQLVTSGDAPLIPFWLLFALCLIICAAAHVLVAPPFPSWEIWITKSFPKIDQEFWFGTGIVVILVLFCASLHWHSRWLAWPVIASWKTRRPRAYARVSNRWVQFAVRLTGVSGFYYLLWWERANPTTLRALVVWIVLTAWFAEGALQIINVRTPSAPTAPEAGKLGGFRRWWRRACDDENLFRLATLGLAVWIGSGLAFIVGLLPPFAFSRPLSDLSLMFWRETASIAFVIWEIAAIGVVAHRRVKSRSGYRLQSMREQNRQRPRRPDSAWSHITQEATACLLAGPRVFARIVRAAWRLCRAAGEVLHEYWQRAPIVRCLGREAGRALGVIAVIWVGFITGGVLRDYLVAEPVWSAYSNAYLLICYATFVVSGFHLFVRPHIPDAHRFSELYLERYLAFVGSCWIVGLLVATSRSANEHHLIWPGPIWSALTLGAAVVVIYDLRKDRIEVSLPITFRELALRLSVPDEAQRLVSLAYPTLPLQDGVMSYSANVDGITRVAQALNCRVTFRTAPKSIPLQPRVITTLAHDLGISWENLVVVLLSSSSHAGLLRPSTNLDEATVRWCIEQFGLRAEPVSILVGANSQAAT